MRCLAELPVEQREAIVLKIWHRFTFEEIGGLLDISPNTAAGRYRYGLQKIKIQLEGTDYGENEMKSLENRLRSWRPRRRRRGLSGGCFWRARPRAAHDTACAGWLAPATACALLTLLILNSENAGHRQRPSAAASWR